MEYPHGATITFFDELSVDYLDQLKSEKLVTKYSRGHPVRTWEVISGRRNEGLDCLAYATAAKSLIGIDPDRREADLASITGPVKRPRVIKSAWLEG